jgi:diguanylate cyclase (GGDEF)-like protein
MKILIAEDDTVSRLVLEQLLTGWGYDVEVTEDGDKAWAALSGHDAPNIALLDWMLPGVEGLDLCRRVRAMKDRPYVYIILLTAKRCIKDIVLGLDAGADDYISKPFDSSELQARVEVGKRIQKLQAQLISGREALRIKAVHDSLTGLLNRAAILEAIDSEMLRTRCDKNPFCVIMADLDHFKAINDFQGHGVGDRVLVETAQRLMKSARKQDLVGRYGGDEFLALLPNTSAEEAHAVADRMREIICNHPFVHNDVCISLSASFGIAQIDPHIDERIEVLLDRADMGAYMAKAEGRNCVRCCEWTPSDLELDAA